MIGKVGARAIGKGVNSPDANSEGSQQYGTGEWKCHFFETGICFFGFAAVYFKTTSKYMLRINSIRLLKMGCRISKE